MLQISGVLSFGAKYQYLVVIYILQHFDAYDVHFYFFYFQTTWKVCFPVIQMLRHKHFFLSQLQPVLNSVQLLNFFCLVQSMFKNSIIMKNLTADLIIVKVSCSLAWLVWCTSISSETLITHFTVSKLFQ